MELSESPERLEAASAQRLTERAAALGMKVTATKLSPFQVRASQLPTSPPPGRLS